MDEEATTSQLSAQEKLLVAQAVYKYGALQWPAISKVLVNHPCCSAQKHLFSPEGCERIYVGLMHSIGANVPAEGATKPNAKIHLRLAQTFYLARMAELRTLIGTYESRFTALLTEITSLKAGKLDDKIREELRSVLGRKHGDEVSGIWAPAENEEELAEMVRLGPASEEERKRAETEAPAKLAAETSQPEEAEEAEAETQETAEEVERDEPGLEAVEDSGAETPKRKNEPLPQEPRKPMSNAESRSRPTSRGKAEPPVVSPAKSADLSPPPEASPAPPPRKRGSRSGAAGGGRAQSLAAETDRAESATPVATPAPTEPDEPVHGTRASKRKASAAPAGSASRPTKRYGRKATSPVPTVVDSEATPRAEDVDMAEPSGSGRDREQESEHPEEDEVQTPQATRGRRASRRAAGSAAGRPSLSGASGATTRRGAGAQGNTSSAAASPQASPSRSRRAASVTSTKSASATPAAAPAATEERRSSRRTSRRGAAEPPKSASAREASAAVESVKEEDDDAEEEVEAEEQQEDAEAEASDEDGEADGQPEDAAKEEEQDEEGGGDDEEEEEEAEEEEEEEKRPTRTSARRRGEKAEPVEDEKEETKEKGKAGRGAAAATATTTRSKRASTRPSVTRESVGAEPSTTTGSTAAARRGPRHSSPRDSKGLRVLLNGLLEQISGHRNGNVFSHPVKANEAPGYYDVIKQPMDLKKIKQRIKDGNITSLDEFERDVYLIFANAMMYNDEDSPVYEMARDMLEFSETVIKEFRAVQDRVGR